MYLNLMQLIKLCLVSVLLLPLAVCSGCGNAKLTVLFSADSEGAKALVAEVAAIGDSNVTVNIASAAIYLPGDTDTPTGGVADLAVGALVAVEGAVNADGVIVATRLTLLPAPTA